MILHKFNLFAIKHGIQIYKVCPSAGNIYDVEHFPLFSFRFLHGRINMDYSLGVIKGVPLKPG